MRGCKTPEYGMSSPGGNLHSALIFVIFVIFAPLSGLIFAPNIIYLCSLCTKLEKVFLPPGASFLRQNFPNMEEEFS